MPPDLTGAKKLQGEVNWAYSILGTVVSATGIVALVLYGVRTGGAEAPLALILEAYKQNAAFWFGWSEPYLSKLGQLPFWWKEGLVMLGLIVSQWVQVVMHKRAKLSEAIEFFGTTLVTGIATYLIDVAQDPLQATFFGIAGVFIQLLVRGSVSFLRGSQDGEAWAGRYLCRSFLLLLVGAAFYFAIDAGLKLPLT